MTENPAVTLALALQQMLPPDYLAEMLSVLVRPDVIHQSDSAVTGDYVDYSSYDGDKPSRWLTLSREQNGLLDTGALVEIGHGKKPRLKFSPSRYLEWLQTNAQRRRGQIT